MIVLRTPKGWTGPKVVDGQPVEGTFRSHQVPLSEPAKNPEHLKQLESWMKSYKPEELFDAAGAFGTSWPSWRRRGTGGWARTRTPTAGCSCTTCASPTSATMPWTSPLPAALTRPTRPCWASSSATW